MIVTGSQRLPMMFGARGTRVPPLLIAKKFPNSAVDHAYHDTTSILKLIEERFHLDPLRTRDAAVTSRETALEAAFAK
jgi:hypothetical protein